MYQQDACLRIGKKSEISRERCGNKNAITDKLRFRGTVQNALQKWRFCFRQVLCRPNSCCIPAKPHLGWYSHSASSWKQSSAENKDFPPHTLEFFKCLFIILTFFEHLLKSILFHSFFSACCYTGSAHTVSSIYRYMHHSSYLHITMNLCFSLY